MTKLQKIHFEALVVLLLFVAGGVALVLGMDRENPWFLIASFAFISAALLVGIEMVEKP